MEKTAQEKMIEQYKERQEKTRIHPIDLESEECKEFEQFKFYCSPNKELHLVNIRVL
jgi:hypothetical protein